MPVASTRSLLPLVSVALLGCGGELAEERDAVNRTTAPIINGSVDSGHKAVGLLYLKGVPSCTATLIGSRTVLTAAHCVTKSKAPPYKPIFPLAFATGPSKSDPMVMVESVAIHPEYGSKIDLAVVRLKQSFKGVTPVRVASAPPTAGEAVTLVGFGFTSDGASGSFGVKRKAHNTIGKVGSKLITFYGASGGEGNICFGDSGGPALALRGGEEVLAGVHSYGDGACGVAEHDVRTDRYLAWIAQQARGDLYPGVNSKDAAPPKIEILSPGPNARLGSSFSVLLGASDDTRVVHVALFVDGGQRYAKGKAPFTFSYQLEGLAGGEHTLRADVVDAAGKRGSTALQVLVQSPHGAAPPTIEREPAMTPASLEGADGDLLLGGCTVAPVGTSPGGTSPGGTGPGGTSPGGTGPVGTGAGTWTPPLLLVVLLLVATRWWSRRGRSG
jgi:hypothetical protein